MSGARRTAVAVLACALACACGRRERPPSALLITLDTTRADALSCYGAPLPTPALDALAREGVRFDAAHTVAPITLPAHASMLTGLYPPRHTVRDNGLSALPSAARTLAEAAREGGLRTGAFIGALVLDESFGLSQGFDVYDVPPRPRAQATSDAAERPASEVVDAALRWLDGDERPFFAWVHLFDAHAPYAPPAELASGPYAGRAYLGEVAALDRAVGRLVEGLRADGRLASTTVIVVGDHGEGLGEHGEETHGTFCYQPTLRVPFVVRWADGADAGTRRDDVASVVDVYPTLVEALGLRGAEGIDGTSLRAPPAEGRGVYFESYSGFLSFGWSPLSGWLDAAGKYLHDADPELFDWRADPGEERDLAAERPEDAARYRRAIAEVAARPALPADEADVDDDLLAELRGLGYASVGSTAAAIPHPLAETGLPSPRSMRAQHARTLEALALANAGEPRRAEPLFRAVLAENPRNWFALDGLARVLIEDGRRAEAIAPLETLLSGGPQWAASWFNLGACLQETQRFDEALVALRRAVELDPRSPLYAETLASALDRAGRADEARAVRAARLAAEER